MQKGFAQPLLILFFLPIVVAVGVYLFFKTNFGIKWATTFGFEPWHSLIEMKRYLSRFIHDAPQHDSMTCVLSSPYCEHDFIILPLLKWLKENGMESLVLKAARDANLKYRKLGDES